MPSQIEHLRQETRNATLAALLNASGAFPDWVIVALAYQAVHLVEAYFASRGRHHQSHGARNRAIANELPEVAFAYFSLQNLSRIARYEADGTLGRDEQELAAAHLAFIEAELRPRL